MAMRNEYEELKQKALTGEQKDINALGKWFELYGDRYWNGEFYSINGEYHLYPIYDEELDEDGELIQSEIVGYELRRF